MLRNGFAGSNGPPAIVRCPVTSGAGWRLGLVVRPALPVVADHVRALLWQPLDLVGLGFPAGRMRNVYVLWPGSEFQKVLQLRVRLRCQLLREICKLDPLHPAFDAIRNFNGGGDRVSFLRAGERNQILASTSANVRCCGSSSLIADNFSRRASLMLRDFGLPPGFGDGPPFFQRVDAPISGLKFFISPYAPFVADSQGRKCCRKA